MRRTPTTIVLATAAVAAIAVLSVRLVGSGTEKIERRTLITRAVVNSGNGISVFHIETSRPARLRLVLVPNSGLPYDDLVLGKNSPGLVTDWRTTMPGSHLVRTHDIHVEATDAQGRTAVAAIHRGSTA